MDYEPIITLLIQYIEIEKGTNKTKQEKVDTIINKTKQEKVDTIINKFKIVLPQNLFIEYYYFILYFLDIYLI
jgi:hypothetical protein